MKRIAILLLTLATLAALPAVAQKQYNVTDKVKLGGEGGWDYLTVDPGSHRLYITRGSHVMVVDTETLKVGGDIPDLSGIHGVALAPNLGKGFISNGGDNSLAVFDLPSLKVVDKVKVGERPDAILYDLYSRRVFTFNAKSQDATAIDGSSAKVAGTIPLGGKPEFPATDNAGKIFVNIEDKSEIVTLDGRKNTVLAHWPLAPCTEPSALAFDVAHRRLFAGCDNKMMAVVNADTGKVVTTIPIGQGVDAGAFNPQTQEVFMSCGDGTLTVVHEDSPDKYTVRQTVETQKGARTMALNPDTNIVYLVTAERSATPPPPGQRPTMVPGSFTLLVVKPQ
jgi:DNA-binding beta-propeller fold protein YncE